MIWKPIDAGEKLSMSEVMEALVMMRGLMEVNVNDPARARRWDSVRRNQRVASWLIRSKGWVLARRGSAMPFVVRVTEWHSCSR